MRKHHWEKYRITVFYYGKTNNKINEDADDNSLMDANFHSVMILSFSLLINHIKFSSLNDPVS